METNTDCLTCGAKVILPFITYEGLYGDEIKNTEKTEWDNYFRIRGYLPCPVCGERIEFVGAASDGAMVEYIPQGVGNKLVELKREGRVDFTGQPVLQNVLEERKRQDSIWGQQNHEDSWWFTIIVEEIGEVAQAILHDKFGGKAAGTVYKELVQVVAVGIAWLECINRRNNRAHS